MIVIDEHYSAGAVLAYQKMILIHRFFVYYETLSNLLHLLHLCQPTNLAIYSDKISESTKRINEFCLNVTKMKLFINAFPVLDILHEKSFGFFEL